MGQAQQILGGALEAEQFIDDDDVPNGKLADAFRYYDPSNKQHVAVLRSS